METERERDGGGLTEGKREERRGKEEVIFLYW